MARQKLQRTMEIGGKRSDVTRCSIVSHSGRFKGYQCAMRAVRGSEPPMCRWHRARQRRMKK